jgi:hypothetical protein
VKEFAEVGEGLAAEAVLEESPSWAATEMARGVRGKEASTIRIRL